MNTSDHPKPHVPWIPAAWLLLILSGALTTNLLRAPLVLSDALPIVLVTHIASGALIALIAIGQLLAQPPRRWWRVALIAGTVVLGWLAHRSFAPLPTASHAALAAFATIALAKVNIGARTISDSPPPRSTSVLARIGFVLVLVQIAAGAALRHHLIGLAWHLFIGGLATMIVLPAAVATVQREIAPPAAKQAARSAIVAIIAQVSLGVAVLFMILLGPPNAGTWIAATAGHVVVGSVTLLAVGGFTTALRRQGSPSRQPDAERQG